MLDVFGVLQGILAPCGLEAPFSCLVATLKALRQVAAWDSCQDLPHGCKVVAWAVIG